MTARTISIDIGTSGSTSGRRVSGVLRQGTSPIGVLLAHGAGADMNTPLLVAMADGLADRGHTTLRVNFLYKELGRGAPDPARVLEATLLAAMADLRSRGIDKLVIGGKSMGGRYSTIVASKGALCDGLVLLGYPLHPAGKPKQLGQDGVRARPLRDAHLPKVDAPMLFVSGTRDSLCDLELFRPVLARLGDRAVLHVVEGGDHSLDLRKSANRPREAVYAELLDVIDAWLLARVMDG